MKNVIENKNLYLAEKLLEFLKNRPNLIIFTPTEPETVSISADLLPQFLPKLTKKEVAQGFLSLEREGVLKYENWKETYQEDYDEIKFFDIIPSQENLKRFIVIGKSNVFGFRLSDEQYRKTLIETLELLIGLDVKAIEIREFHQKDSYDILQRISDFSDAISVEDKLNVDFERDDDGEIQPMGGGYIPNIVIVKNKIKLKTILNKVRKTINDIYKDGISIFLAKNNILEWRCLKCSRWLGSYDSPLEIMQWLDKFSNGDYKACHKCRNRNIFSISAEGNINFLIIKKRG